MSFLSSKPGDFLSAQGVRHALRHDESHVSHQIVAATLAADKARVLSVTPLKGLASFTAILATGVAADESLVVTLSKIASTGTETVIATFTLNSTTAPNAGTVSMNSGIAAAHTLIAGDIIVVNRTYTAGGGPSMTDNSIMYQVE